MQRRVPPSPQTLPIPPPTERPPSSPPRNTALFEFTAGSRKFIRSFSTTNRREARAQVVQAFVWATRRCSDRRVTPTRRAPVCWQTHEPTEDLWVGGRSLIFLQVLIRGWIKVTERLKDIGLRAERRAARRTLSLHRSNPGSNQQSARPHGKRGSPIEMGTRV